MRMPRTPSVPDSYKCCEKFKRNRRAYAPLETRTLTREARYKLKVPHNKKEAQAWCDACAPTWKEFSVRDR